MADTSASAASLRFLLLGDVGVGKTAFITTFASTLSAVQDNNAVEEFIPVPVTSATSPPSAIRLPGVHISAGPVLQDKDQSSPLDDPLTLLPPKVDVPARDLTFVTLPGYSSTINPSTVLSLTDDYLNHHLHTATSIFSPTIPSAQLAWFLIAGSRAHSLPTCAFYFVLYELKPIDILYMKMIHERVNLIPVITKADTLPKNELWILKKRMLRQLKLNGIRIHTFGSDMDTIEQMTQQRQWGAPPFVVSTRRDSEGQLLDSELKRLVDLCLYDRVRHLQEDAARKVIAWKQAFGVSGNPAKTNVEKVWGERDVTKAANGAVAGSLVDGDGHKPYIAQVDTRPTGQYAPLSPQHQQQPQPFSPSTPAPHLATQYAAPTNLPFTPPPSLTNNGLSSPANFGLPATTYAHPPSFSNGTVTGYTAPPPSFNKPLPLLVTSTGYQPGTNGLVSPPPSASHASSSAYAATSNYSHPPRTTSANITAIASQTRVPLAHSTTGMPIDNFSRPSEIKDEIPAHLQSQNGAHEYRHSFMESYAPQTGGSVDNASTSPSLGNPTGTSASADRNEVKVEIPNSGTSYQPSTLDSVTDLNNTHSAANLMQQQQQALYGSFQNPAAFLIPAIMANTGAALTNEYGEAIPDIWEAAELGDVATVQLHLNNGVSPDQRNNSRSTLLHRTAWQGVKPHAVMKLLISYGANVNLTNENGNTVLQNVLMKHDDPTLIKLLLDNGAQAMIPNREGMNTLEVAALFNKLESARHLLENDLSSSESQSIVNALQRARSPDKKAMKVLLKGWHGKDGERKRLELIERQRGPPLVPSNDAASIRSFETTKGDGKSKWRLKF
ncbi:septin 2 [Dissophora ornata]|nr:septin 2 [Dissophora ornata]